jgi:GT2 family glycosyltransferase
MNKQPVYIIIPVHNRKAVTLKCLKNLADNGDLDKYYVIVVDDGSTDGTSEAVHDLYPEVIILTGDGNLWWTGAIEKGMKYAYERGAHYFIWLNDDCYPHEGAIGRLTDLCSSSSKIIAGGQCYDPDTLQKSYAGIVLQKNDIIEVASLTRKVIECDAISGHLACISRQLVQEIGYPDSQKFPHYYGDHIYTLTAKKIGYKLIIEEKATAFAKNDHPEVSWLNPDKPLLLYWQEYFTIKSSSYWRAELNYYQALFGIRGIVLYIYLKIIRFWLFFIFVNLTPSSFREFLKRSRS